MFYAHFFRRYPFAKKSEGQVVTREKMRHSLRTKKSSEFYPLEKPKSLYDFVSLSLHKLLSLPQITTRVSNAFN